MKKVSLGLLTLAAVSFSVLPASAMKTETTSEQIDASQQIEDAVTPAGCVLIPFYGWYCS